MPGENPPLRPVYVFSLGLFFQPRMRRILALSGYQMRLGIPRGDAMIGVWGRKPVGRFAERFARRFNFELLTLEDSIIRSIRTGRQGDHGIGIVLDQSGIYFATDQHSDFRQLMQDTASLGPEEQERGRALIRLLKDFRLSKYNDHDPDLAGLPERFVLVVDQTMNDASIALGGGAKELFTEMLRAAREDHPDTPILIKTHPETNAGKRAGHFSVADTDARTQLWTRATNPWDLFELAEQVYTVTSTMGFEAILADVPVATFGRPFYAGCGLTDDRNLDQVPKKKLPAWALAYQFLVTYSKWYDPALDRLISPEDACRNLTVQRRTHMFSQQQPIGLFMRLWKRGFMQRYFGISQFAGALDDALSAARETGAPILAWASKVTPEMRSAAERNGAQIWNVEDGFLRSSGLGAALVKPVSLAIDDLGVYYDPSRESRLETLIAQRATLSVEQEARADALKQAIIAARLSKYNLKSTAELPERDGRLRILVPGQVEDDASILTATQPDLRGNGALIRAVRNDFPEAELIYKPHPDVVAGMRNGGQALPLKFVDHIVEHGDITALIDDVDHVATMTSLTGFEALLRGKSVSCYGAPFYAGWGLTDDRVETPARRVAHPSLEGLIYAALIDYPLYWDPVTGEPATPEAIVARFASGQVSGRSGPGLKLLSKAQGALISFAPFWR